MPYQIILAPEALEDLKALKANVRASVKEALAVHLRDEPEKTSRSRIKRLRGLSQPQYRLRVDEIRVFYDVTAEQVQVLAVVPKSETEAWLAQFGKPEPEKSLSPKSKTTSRATSEKPRRRRS